MKKAIVLILIAIVAVSSAFAFKFNSVGIETGLGFGASISADMEIIDNLDVYVRLGYYNAFDISFGAQYQLFDFKLDNVTVPFKAGAQMDFFIVDDSMMFMMLGTAQVSFSTGHLTAFARPGLGFSAYRYETWYYDAEYNKHTEKKTHTEFRFIIETGIAYSF